MKNGDKKKGGLEIAFNNRNSVQEWLPIEKIFENGIIKLKNNNYIKILKINPINYHLKSELEKEAILNSYKIFLKTCNFNLQILIQSNREDLSQNISNLKNSQKNEKNNNIKKITEKYIEYLNELNISKKSSVKNYFIIIKLNKKNTEKNNLENIKNIENNIFDELNDNYLKIKDTLSRCGNIVFEINNKETIKNILFSFFNSKINKYGGDI